MGSSIEPLDISILDWFESPRSRGSVASYAFWNDHGGPRLDVAGAIHRLLSSGHLRELSAQEKLVDLENSRLQAELKARGLKSSGTKKVLVARLEEALSEAQISALTMGSDLTELTGIGRSALGLARQHDEELCSAAIRSTAEKLQKHNFEGAIQEVLSVAIVRGGVPAAVPKSFRQVDDPPSVDELRSLFSSRPESLDGLAESVLAELRIATGMYILWKDNPDRYVGATISTGDLPLQVAINHLWSEASRRGKALHLKGSVVLENFQSRDPSCGKCTRLIGKSFEILELAPRLPLKGCLTTAGCPLHFERDWDDDPFDGIEVDVDFLPSETEPDELARRLHTARGLCDEGLISEREYEDLKSQILRRLGEN